MDEYAEGATTSRLLLGLMIEWVNDLLKSTKKTLSAETIFTRGKNTIEVFAGKSLNKKSFTASTQLAVRLNQYV